MAAEYANMTSTSGSNIPLLNKTCYKRDDDSGEGWNFKIECKLKAGTKYFLVIRTYNTFRTQKFTNIYIEKIK